MRRGADRQIVDNDVLHSAAAVHCTLHTVHEDEDEDERVLAARCSETTA